MRRRQSTQRSDRSNNSTIPILKTTLSPRPPLTTYFDDSNTTTKDYDDDIYTSRIWHKKNPTSTYMCGSLRRPRALTKICNLFKFYVCARVVDLEILVALLQLGAAFFVLTNHFKTWKKNCINVTVNMSEIIKKRRERNIPKNVLFYVMCCY